MFQQFTKLDLVLCVYLISGIHTDTSGNVQMRHCTTLKTFPMYLDLVTHSK